MHSRLRILLLVGATALFVGCAAQAPRPAPAATPAAPAPPARQEEQPPAPAAAAPAPAGQTAPSSANQQVPTSLTTGEKKAKKPEFNNVADAEAALARANRQLVAMYAPTAGGATRRGAAAKAPPAAGRASAESTTSQQSRCATACKAFASLRRAADAVCRLAGKDDARCHHARDLVDENSRRVAQCGCSDE